MRSMRPRRGRDGGSPSAAGGSPSRREMKRTLRPLIRDIRSSDSPTASPTEEAPLLASAAGPEGLGLDAARPRAMRPGRRQARSDPAWVEELRTEAPAPASPGGLFSSVMQAENALMGTDAATLGTSTSDLSARLDALEAKLDVEDSGGATSEASAVADEARDRIATGQGDAAELQAIVERAGGLWTRADGMSRGQLGIGAQGRADMDRLAAAASTPWYSTPQGQCYGAVAGFSSESYVNEAGGRWAELANRIPSSHSSWAVSFAHWLQETASGQRAAAELGFEIVESDGQTPLGQYLADHPELKGSIVVIPHGQQGTASREWDAAAAYGDEKWGAGVGDVSVVTEIGERGATYVADAKIPHDAATMWWVVYPK